MLPFLHPRATAPLLLLAAATIGTPAHADATLDKIRSRGEVAIGVIISDGSEFGALNPATRQPQGLNPELAQEIGRRLGVGTNLVHVIPSNRIQFLQQGKVDLLVATMLYTDERAQQLSYAPTAYYEHGGNALFRQDSGIRRWEDLKGRPVCLSQGSSWVTPATALGADIRAMRTVADSLLALKSGASCVALMADHISISKLVKQPEWQGYTRFDEQAEINPHVVWARKGETDTIAAVEQILQELHRSGWLLELVQRSGLPSADLLVRKNAELNGTAAGAGG